MVIPTLGEHWAARLARLRQRVIEQPDGPIWFWGMRIRILEFLIARYEQPPTMRRHNITCADQVNTEFDFSINDWESESDDVAEPPNLASRAFRSMNDMEHPPKMLPAMLPILDRLELVNEQNRILRWTNPPPEAAWEWWRTVWCCAPEDNDA